MKYLKSKMSDEGEKLKADEETFCQIHSHISRIQVLIFISHYKCFTGGNQPLILVEFVNSSSQQYMNKYYLGQTEFHSYLNVMLQKLPIFNTHTTVSEIMVAIVKIMAHSIVQLGIGPGFPLHLFWRLQHSNTVYKS